jgi:hypothetical protein
VTMLRVSVDPSPTELYLALVWVGMIVLVGFLIWKKL